MSVLHRFYQYVIETPTPQLIIECFCYGVMLGAIIHVGTMAL